MSDRLSRLRLLVADNLVPVVVGLIVLGAVGGWLTYGAYVDPGTTTERRTVSTWSERADLSHEATVTEPNPLYDVGTTLRNRSAYFTAVAPVLDGSYAYAYEASDGGNLSGEVTTRLVVRSVGEVETDDGSREVVYWRTSERLGTAEFEELAPGERVTVPFSVDLARTANRTDRIREGLGSSGEVETRLVVRTELDGTVNGREVSNVTERVAPMDLSGDAARVSPLTGATATHERTASRQVPREPGALGSFGGPTLLLAALGGLGVVGGVARSERLGPTPGERERLDHARTREELDEWITPGRPSAEALDGPTVPVDSLRGLVDTAIDTDGRVIEIVEEDRYVLLDGEVVYEYDPPSARRPVAAESDERTDEGDGPGGEVAEGD